MRFVRSQYRHHDDEGQGVGGRDGAKSEIGIYIDYTRYTDLEFCCLLK